jgi:hypothetical protein
VDPEVVAQFNCLQQTGNFCPSASNGPTTMSGTANSLSTTGDSSTTTRGNSAPIQTAVDAFFALMGTQDSELGLSGLSTISS